MQLAPSKGVVVYCRIVDWLPLKNYNHRFCTNELSIGINYDRGRGKTCLIENGRVAELLSFMDVAALLAYLEHTCALYSEPVVALASASDESPHSIEENIRAFLIAIDSINLKT